MNLNSGVYVDSEKGPNWWEYFFEPICMGDENAASYVFSGRDVLDLTVLGSTLPKERANELIQKYIHIKPDIQQEVDDYIEKYFKDHFIIGIHHRGTDKIKESPLVPYPNTLRALNWLIMNIPSEFKNKVRIYIATDEDKFLKYMLGVYPSLIVYNDFVRSKDENALHYSKDLYSGNYQKGKEALIDCLLLSKTNCLLHPGTSTLSLMAERFNPHLPALKVSQ